jgi:hypothetical protein
MSAGQRNNQCSFYWRVNIHAIRRLDWQVRFQPVVRVSWRVLELSQVVGSESRKVPQPKAKTRVGPPRWDSGGAASWQKVPYLVSTIH